MAITTFLFDFGGVLFGPLNHDEVWARRDQLARRLGLRDGREMWHCWYNGPEWAAAKTGRMTNFEMWDALLRPHGFSLHDEQRAFVAELFQGEGVYPGMVELLKTLHGRYQLSILSNADDRLEWRLEQEGLASYFGQVFNSHRLGVAKPDTAAFHLALERLNVRPAEVFFIDDQERNTAAARALGMAAHRFVDVAALRAALEPKDL